MGPLAPEPGDGDEGVLLAAVDIKTLVIPSTLVKTQIVTCRIPSVQAKIRQSTIEGLQFFADDITHWLDGAFGDGSAPKPRDDLKLIGSRFFGSKGSSSASSSAIEDDEDDESASATVLRVIVSEMDIALHVPRATVGERVLSLRASDVDAKIESNTTGRQETAFSLAVMDADFSDRSDPQAQSCILSRTTPLTLTVHNQPILYLRFSTFSNAVTGTKETGVKLACSCFTLYVRKDIAWVQELAQFAKTPEGVFEDVVPSEMTRISVQLFDCSVQVSAPTLPGAIVVVLGVVDVKTDLVSDDEENSVEIGISSSYLLAVDDVGATGPLAPGFTASIDAWKVSWGAWVID